MLTALVTTPSVSAARTCWAVITPARSWASSVAAPRWGVTTTSGRPNSGCSVIGSAGNTSSAAPATFPDSRPACSASRSTSSPRAALMIRTPFFIREIASTSIQLAVSGVRGRWMVMMSARPYSSSVDSTPSMPSSRKRSAATNLSYATTSIPNASARWPTSWPILPNPMTPIVFPYSSFPLKLERSHLPPASEAWAWGTLRHRASASASVCSAAATELDSGALATTIPRFVAASTSTLSTPVPARPITLSRSARPINSAVTLVPERISSASNSPIRLSSSSSDISSPSSTSNSSRRSSTPDSAIGSLTRTRIGLGDRLGGHAGLGEHPLRAADAGTRLDRETELPQRHLERRQGDDDVEAAVVAAVSDAHELALEAALAAGDRYPEAVAHQLRHTGPRDVLRQQRGGDDVGVVVVRTEPLQPQRFDPRAGGAGEQRVARENAIQALGQDQAEGHVERHEQGDGRREGAVRRILALAGRGQAPVEVVAPPGVLRGQRERPLRRRHEGQPRRAHQRLLGARDDDIHPPFVLGQIDRAEPGDGVDAQDGAPVPSHLAQRADVVDDAGRGLGLGGEQGPRGPTRLGERRVDPVGVELLTPIEGDVPGPGPVCLAHVVPALAKLPRRGDDDGLVGYDEVGDRGLHAAAARRGEAQHVVARPEHGAQVLQHPRVDLDECGRAVVHDRLGHHLADRRRQGRRAGGHQVLLGEDLGCCDHGGG